MDQSRATCHDQRGDWWANHVGKNYDAQSLIFFIFLLKFSQGSWITVTPNFYDSCEEGLSNSPNDGTFAWKYDATVKENLNSY